MSETFLEQSNSFVDKMVNPSEVDQFGADLVAEKEVVKTWTETKR